MDGIGCSSCAGVPPLPDCPVMCITKSLSFLMIAIFILYLPLGDINSHCSNQATKNSVGPLCTLCDVHTFILQLADKTSLLSNFIINRILGLLYEAKLQIYALLVEHDRDDLCHKSCCKNSEIEEEFNEQGETLHQYRVQLPSKVGSGCGMKIRGCKTRFSNRRNNHPAAP